MKPKKSIQDEINDFLCLWGFDQITSFMKDLFPLLDLYNVDEGDDWLKEIVEEEDVRNVRLVRTVYLMSKICEFHGNRMSSTNNNFKHLWKRMEQINGNNKI